LRDICAQDRCAVSPNDSRAKDRPYLSLEDIESNTGRIFHDASIPVENEGNSTTFLFDSRHVLYGKLRPYLNKVALPDFSGRCTTELIPLLPCSELTREFFALLLRRDVTVATAMRDKTGSRMPRADLSALMEMEVPLPPLPIQRRIAAQLKEQLDEVDRARTALQAQLDAADALVSATLRQSLTNGATIKRPIADCLQEVTKGIGVKWSDFPVLGATRSGLAPAKEGVGKAPERYKPVRIGSVFYNPMRILLGSIAMVDDDDAPGITSPDYVVMISVEGVLHPRWFYHWFRSDDGAAFVRSLTRGAVRERLLFKRLAPAEIRIPPWSVQVAAAEIIQAATTLQKITLARIATLDQLPAALLSQVFGQTPQAAENLHS
jgi:type I restriction enzyme S subunit